MKKLTAIADALQVEIEQSSAKFLSLHKSVLRQIVDAIRTPDEPLSVQDIPWPEPSAKWPDIAVAIRAIYPMDGHKGCGEIALAAATEIEKLRTAQPPAEWRCFHCDEVFTDWQAAGDHFGPHQGSEPGCAISVAEYRRMEECCRSHHEEDTELHRALHAKSAEMLAAVRQAEEQGYARGLEDAKRHPETLGLTRAAQPPLIEPAAEQSAANSGPCVSREAAQSGTTAGSSLPPANEPAVEDGDHLERFTAYVVKEIPPGTIISNPQWWAKRLLAAAIVTAPEAPALPPAVTPAAIHAMCAYIRDKACSGCKGSIDTPYGSGTPGCFAIARWHIETALRVTSTKQPQPPSANAHKPTLCNGDATKDCSDHDDFNYCCNCKTTREQRSALTKCEGR